LNRNKTCANWYCKIQIVSAAIQVFPTSAQFSLPSSREFFRSHGQSFKYLRLGSFTWFCYESSNGTLWEEKSFYQTSLYFPWSIYNMQLEATKCSFIKKTVHSSQALVSVRLSWHSVKPTFPVFGWHSGLDLHQTSGQYITKPMGCQMQIIRKPLEHNSKRP